MKNQIINKYLKEKRKEDLKIILEGAIIAFMWVGAVLLAMLLTTIVIIKIYSM